MKIAKIFILFFLFCMFSSKGFSAAFLIYNQDAKANGMGMAVSATIDNASSVFYNPALLTETKGYDFSIGDIIIYPKMSFNDPITQKKYYTKTGAHHIPHIYAKYSTGKVSFGMGIFSPFGLSTEWSNRWSGRYNIVFAEIKTTFINPVIAYKLNDYLSFGGGVSFIKSSVNFKSALNLFPLQDGISRLSGDGEGIGFNGALFIKLPKNYFFSATYRTPVNIKYKGTAKFYLPAPLLNNQTDASTKLTLPFLFVTGIGKRDENLVIEMDLLFTGWSSMNNYKIKSDNGMADGFYYKDWRNSISLALGADYTVNKNNEIRAGYMFDRTPIPKRTLGPELPDSNRHIFTMGYSYKKGLSRLNMGYQATFFEKRRSRLYGMEGKYSGFAHLLMIGFDFGR